MIIEDLRNYIKNDNDLKIKFSGLVDECICVGIGMINNFWGWMFLENNIEYNK